MQKQETDTVCQNSKTMDISYKNNKLKKFAEDATFSIRHLGALRSELYLRRIGDLMAAATLEDVRNLPGHYHDLKGDRKGQWACDLDQPYRLIFEPHESPTPTNQDGQFIWCEIKGVEIIEIDNYHGK